MKVGVYEKHNDKNNNNSKCLYTDQLVLRGVLHGNIEHHLRYGCHSMWPHLENWGPASATKVGQAQGTEFAPLFRGCQGQLVRPYAHYTFQHLLWSLGLVASNLFVYSKPMRTLGKILTRNINNYSLTHPIPSKRQK